MPWDGHVAPEPRTLCRRLIPERVCFWGAPPNLPASLSTSALSSVGCRDKARRAALQGDELCRAEGSSIGAWCTLSARGSANPAWVCSEPQGDI